MLNDDFVLYVNGSIKNCIFVLGKTKRVLRKQFRRIAVSF